MFARRLDFALSHSQQSLALHINLYNGEDHPRVAMSQCTLASVLQDIGFMDEAESLVQDAIATVKNYFGDRCDYEGDALVVLASILIGKKQCLEACQAAYRALSIKISCFGPSHPEVAKAHIGMHAQE